MHDMQSVVPPSARTLLGLILDAPLECDGFSSDHLLEKKGAGWQSRLAVFIFKREASKYITHLN